MGLVGSLFYGKYASNFALLQHFPEELAILLTVSSVWAASVSLSIRVVDARSFLRTITGDPFSRATQNSTFVRKSIIMVDLSSVGGPLSVINVCHHVGSYRNRHFRSQRSRRSFRWTKMKRQFCLRYSLPTSVRPHSSSVFMGAKRCPSFHHGRLVLPVFYFTLL